MGPAGCRASSADSLMLAGQGAGLLSGLQRGLTHFNVVVNVAFDASALLRSEPGLAGQPEGAGAPAYSATVTTPVSCQQCL